MDCSPYYEFAIEEAIKIKEKLGTGEVILITMGPPRSAEALRTGLAMGADSAIHIKDESFAFTDPYAIAKVIGQEIRSLGGFDLILTGKKMIDEETGQVGIHVADGNGDVETADLLWDDEDKVLLIYYEGECGAEEAGLWGCKFDANGNATACGVAVLDEKNDDLVIVTVSE